MSSCQTDCSGMAKAPNARSLRHRFTCFLQGAVLACTRAATACATGRSATGRLPSTGGPILHCRDGWQVPGASAAPLRAKHGAVDGAMRPEVALATLCQSNRKVSMPRSHPNMFWFSVAAPSASVSAPSARASRSKVRRSSLIASTARPASTISPAMARKMAKSRVPGACAHRRQAAHARRGSPTLFLID